MSSKIDERIVGMKFNGSQFIKGIGDTTSALDKLKSALNLGGAAKGLNDLDAASKNFSLANIANGVQDLSSKFNAMSVVGITALANIASKAVDAGLTIAKSLTIDPMKAGFAEYELKMGSIQTILANTARYGTQLPEVVSNLDELNEYADKTIYNFGDMTKNIGLFTNAGIRIEDATSMIKGFSNEAAASGTSAQGAAGAAYQLSQALSSGVIRAQDWISLTNVGMGNKNMQDGLYQIAVAMGKVNEGSELATSIQTNLKGSLEENWLTTDIMSSYLRIMAGDMDDAAMASLGLNSAQIEMFKKQQTMAQDSATKVRTFTQLVGTLQEGVGSGWAQTFDLLVGDFNQATDLFTAVYEKLDGIIGGMSDARNNLLKEFVDGGGRDAIINSVANIWKAIERVVMPIKEAFQDIFPPVTASNLIEIVKAIEAFTKSLIPGGYQMQLIKDTFKGLFAALDIGRMIFMEVIGLFGRLFGVATEGAGGILKITSNMGKWVVGVRDAIKEGTFLQDMFKKIGDVLQWPIDRLRELGQWTVNAIGTWDLAKAWEAVANAFKKIGEFLGPVWTELGNFFRDAKKVLGDFFSSLDFNVLVGLMNFGALAGIGLGLKKAFDFLKGGGIMALIFGEKDDSEEGMIDKIKGVFGAITDTFGELQNTLKSTTLIGIGIAIGLITASVVALSFVDTGKLFIVLGAMTIMFGQLSAMLLAIDNLTKKTSPAKMIAVGIALGALAGAMLIMSIAVKILSTMDWEELAKGITGLAVGMGILVGAANLMNKVAGKLYFTAPALAIMAGAMLLLAGAMKIFSTMSWDDLLRSGVVFAGVMGVMVGAMVLVKSNIGAAASMVLMAAAVNIIAGAMKVFSSMSWDDIGRSAVAMAAAMGIMVGALLALDLLKFSPVGAATMIAMSVAITILSGAMKVFASMSWDDIGRGLVVMGASLAILAGAMALMGIPLVALGGAALFVVAAGMTMLAPAMMLFGSMDWDSIGRGLTFLAGTLGILAVGGLLLIPASVGFLLFGAALLLIGGAVLLAGQGLALFMGAFTAFVAVAVAGAPAIKTALETIASAIPAMMASFAQGIIDFALVIAQGATAFTQAATVLIQSFVMGIANNVPLIIQTITNIVSEMMNSASVLIPQFITLGVQIVTDFVNAVVNMAPFLVDSGITLIVSFLNGLAARIGEVIAAGTNLIVRFIEGIGTAAGRIAAAGADTIIKFVNSLASTIETRSADMRNAGLRLATAILDGMTGGLFSGASRVINAAAQMAGNALNAAKKALGINSPSKEFFKVGGWSAEGVALGIDKKAPMAIDSAENMANGALKAMQNSLSAIKNSVASDMEFSPTIKPILDLTAVQKGSGLIGGILTPPSLKVENGYAYASSIATTQREYQDIRDENDGGNNNPSGDNFTYVQNNYSPKALAASDIYRRTNSQLSVIKKGQPK